MSIDVEGWPVSKDASDSARIPPAIAAEIKALEQAMADAEGWKLAEMIGARAALLWAYDPETRQEPSPSSLILAGPDADPVESDATVIEINVLPILLAIPALVLLGACVRGFFKKAS